MKINTKVLGEIEIDERQVFDFPGGLLGLPELTRFALICVSRIFRSPSSVLRFFIQIIGWMWKSRNCFRWRWNRERIQNCWFLSL